MKYTIVLLVSCLLLASCVNHGKKISEDYLEVYYKDGATEQQARKIFDYLLPRWKDNGENTSRKSVQLTATGDTINFRMVSRMDAIEKMDKSIFYTMGNELSDLLNGRPVNVVLTDDAFKELRTYTYYKRESQNFGRKVSSGYIEVYVVEGTSLQTGKQLASFLNREMNPEKTISFQLEESEQGHYNVRMVSSEEKAKEITYDSISSFLASMSREVFNGDPIVMDFTDDKFNPIASFDQQAH